jgi:hypothetical protein
MNICNYPAQVIHDVSKQIVLGSYSDQEAAVMTGVIASLKTAVHFQLPDGGRIIDDELRGLEHQQLRLPYHALTLSYSEPSDPNVPKRLLYVAEPPAELNDLFTAKLKKASSGLSFMNKVNWDEGVVIVIAFFYFAEIKAWTPAPLIAYLPKDGWYGGRTESGSPLLTAAVRVVLDEMYTFVTEGNKENEDRLSRDFSSELFVLCEFCEALTCCNIQPEVLQHADRAVNRRREAKGKLPLYEMRTLVVTNKGVPTEMLGKGLHHNSPRQHLRRGHIRRSHKVVGKQWWVNSHLVGDAKRGRIDKQYVVRAA